MNSEKKLKKDLTGPDTFDKWCGRIRQKAETMETGHGEIVIEKLIFKVKNHAIVHIKETKIETTLSYM